MSDPKRVGGSIGLMGSLAEDFATNEGFAQLETEKHI